MMQTDDCIDSAKGSFLILMIDIAHDQGGKLSNSCMTVTAIDLSD